MTDKFGNRSVQEYDFPDDHTDTWTLFDPVHGLARYTLIGPWKNARLTAENGKMGVIPGAADLDRHWVRQNEFQDRPSMPIVVDGTTIRNIPVPCSLGINGKGFDDVVEDHIEFEFPEPGSYRVEIFCEPYILWSHTFEN